MVEHDQGAVIFDWSGFQGDEGGSNLWLPEDCVYSLPGQLADGCTRRACYLTASTLFKIQILREPRNPLAA